TGGSGTAPLWSRNGRELFFQRIAKGTLAIDGIMVVPYTTKDALFAPEKPHLWSDRQMMRTTAGKTYDLAPDGKRFAIIELPVNMKQRPDTHVNLLLNYSEELRRLMASEGK